MILFQGTKQGERRFLTNVSVGLDVFKGRGSGCEICWMAIEIREGNTLSGHAHSGIMPLHGRHDEKMGQQATNEGNLWVYPHRGYFPLLGHFCSTLRTLSSQFIHLNSSYWFWTNFLQTRLINQSSEQSLLRAWWPSICQLKCIGFRHTCLFFFLNSFIVMEDLPKEEA